MTKAKTKHNACFVAGTLVHTDKGLVPIQDLKIGDKVLSRPENGDDILSYQPIISTFKSQKKEKIYKVEYFNQTAYQRGENGISYILCTANHPFWVTKQPNSNKGLWLAAEDLPAGYLTSANKDIIELSDYAFLPVRTLPSFPNGYGYTQWLEEHDSWNPTNLSDVIFIKFNPEEYTYISFGRNDEERKSFKNSFGISEIIDPTEILGNKESISYHPEDYGLLRVRLAQDTMKHYRSKKVFLDTMYAPFIVDGKVLKENSIIDEVAFQKALARLEKYGKDLPQTYGESLHFSMEYYTDTPINSYEDYVYNIEVENNHTYFVGEDGLWVHDVNVILKLKNDSPLWTYKE